MKNLIKYIMGIAKDEEGLNKPVYSHQEIDCTYLKTYGDAVYKLVNIHGCARNLIEYLAMTMDSNNIVELSAHQKDKFLADIKKGSDGEMTYSHIMIKKSIRVLKDAEMLIPQNKRGIYQVNPEYYFKGKSEQRRLDMIKANLEKGFGRKQ